MNTKQKILLIIIIFIATLIGSLVLYTSRDIIFPQPEQITTLSGQILSINPDNIIISNNDNPEENIEIFDNQIKEIYTFDPYTHNNLTSNKEELLQSDNIVLKCNHSICNLIKMPTFSIVGMIQNISEENTIELISDGNSFFVTTNKDTLFLDPDKNITTPESLHTNNILFIYSNNNISDNKITAASIQILQ